MGIRFFSRLPTGGAPHRLPDLDGMAAPLALASLAIGVGPALLLLLLGLFEVPSYFAATLAIAAQIAVCGAMTEDAIADAADGLFGGQSAERRLEIMKDSRHGSYGVAALAILLLARVTALGALQTPFAAAGLLFSAPLMARSGALWLALALPPARAEGAAAAAGRLRPTSYFSGMALAALLGISFWFPFVGLAGFAIGVCLCALVLWGWTTLCRRLVGGQTGDLIGAAQALLEIALLSAFMLSA